MNQSSIDQLLPHLQLLDDRQDLMLQQVIQLCDINSGTRNLAGLEVVAQQLTGLFESLGGQLQLVDSCLLYTSPSPRDGLLSRMPSSA